MRAAATLCSPAAASAAFITLWALFFFSLAAMYLLPSGRALIAARVVVLISLAGILVSVGFIALQRINDDSRDQAIVLAGTVTAKSSPDQASVDAFVIHEGLKVRMSDALGTWVKVTLPDGKVGWIPSSACERI
jgi:hypothetical protein